MLTDIDSELFPDDCEVVEIPSHSQWIYLIQKNGSSSLRIKSRQEGWRIFKNTELKSLDHVDVYIRDARQRYISGVNTYLQFLKRDHPTLDRDTVIWFVNKYRFLNRHFLPQWHWLVNLSRYLHSDCKIRLHRFDGFSYVIDVNSRAGIVPSGDDFANEIIDGVNQLELWFYLDQILWDLSGSSMTWKQLLDHYQTQHTECYNLITSRFQTLKNVLP